jgi:hypothetical protein
MGIAEDMVTDVWAALRLKVEDCGVYFPNCFEGSGGHKIPEASEGGGSASGLFFQNGHRGFSVLQQAIRRVLKAKGETFKGFCSHLKVPALVFG